MSATTIYCILRIYTAVVRDAPVPASSKPPAKQPVQRNPMPSQQPISAQAEPSAAQPATATRSNVNIQRPSPTGTMRHGTDPHSTVDSTDRRTSHAQHPSPPAQSNGRITHNPSDAATTKAVADVTDGPQSSRPHPRPRPRPRFIQPIPPTLNPETGVSSKDQPPSSVSAALRTGDSRPGEL